MNTSEEANAFCRSQSDGSSVMKRNPIVRDAQVLEEKYASCIVLSLLLPSTLYRGRYSR